MFPRATHRNAFLLFAVSVMACPIDICAHSASADNEQLERWAKGSFASEDGGGESSARLVVSAANRCLLRYLTEPPTGDCKGGTAHSNTEQDGLLQRLPSIAYAALLAATSAVARQSIAAHETVLLDVSPPARELEAAEETRVRHILDAAGGDAGHASLRDLVLSFRARRDLIGTRRTLLLNRAQCESLREQTPEVLRQTHATVSGGPAHLFATSTDDVDRACCLLAGLAMQLQSTVNGVPFDGHIGLPFIAGWTACAVQLVDCVWVANGACFGVGVSGLLAAVQHAAAARQQ